MTVTKEQLTDRHTGLPMDWGVATGRDGTEMYVWIYSDAHTDDWIDARGYAADFDLSLKRRIRKAAK